MKITAVYAGLLALLYIALSFRTILYRREHKVEIGDGGDRQLLRRIRVHANFAEYVPITLLLMGLAESLGLPGLGLHLIGLVLLLGRIAHAYGLSQTPHILSLRAVGTVSTQAAILAGALACLWLGLAAMR